MTVRMLLGGRQSWLPLVAVFLAASLAAAVVDEPRNRTFTDYATDILPDTPDYDRCKTTHRCNRARADYYVREGRYQFTKQRFIDGSRENADLFLNFENWRAGTVGLGTDHVRLIHTCTACSTSL